MGILAKSLAPPSAYSAKKRAVEGGYDLFGDVKDRIDGALLLVQLTELEAWLDANDHTIPGGWRECFDDMIDARREELAEEDINMIVRSRFDCT